MMKNNKTLFILWFLCIVGSLAIIPYAYYTNLLSASKTLIDEQWGSFLLLVTGQAFVVYGIVLWLSFLIVPKTDLKPLEKSLSLKNTILHASFIGLCVAAVLFLLTKTIFTESIPLLETPPLWTSLLASLYGGINEEILLRLFLFSGIYLLFSKIGKNRQIVFWTTNILVAFAFGIGHLPAAYQLIDPTSWQIMRLLVLNGIAGVAFGWLYWKEGLLAAMIAHFCADIFLHGIFSRI